MTNDLASSEAAARDAVAAHIPEPPDPGPLGWLPRVSRRQLQVEGRLARLSTDQGCLRALRWLEPVFGAPLAAARADLLWRASGLLRPGLVAQLAWPSRHARLAVGIETPLAHAIVDKLLGFERDDARTRRQLTPVEWGILTFVVARSLDALTAAPGGEGLDDLVLDRVGAEPFSPGDLGAIVTLRWPVRLARVAGAIRLWVPESALVQWLEALPRGEAAGGAWEPGPRFADLTSQWRALAGSVTMPRGLGRLRVGAVVPIDPPGLQGTPQHPVGMIKLVLDPPARHGGFLLRGEAAEHSGGARLVVISPLERDTSPREALAVNAGSDPEDASSPAPNSSSPAGTPEIPVTLVVELGRVSMSLARLADLKPGDVIELGRHSREPVELTSGGRLVARGELVQIDTELGVRLTNVFL
jgi:type III secretion system YscQ/HrcQ family protein